MGVQATVVDDDKPLIKQLVHLAPADYQAWLLRTSRGKARFFESDALEAVTTVKWWMVPLLWLPIAALLGVQASAALPLRAAAALAAAGVVLWQFIEYALHRWVFHAAPSGPLAIVAHFLMHGNHHKFPSDTDRLVFPPLPACLPAGAIYGTLRTLLPKATAAGMFCGVLFGYVAYDCMHYLMHSGHLRGRLRTRHMHHHYADHTACFGISSPLFDTIFGTQMRPGKRRD